MPGFTFTINESKMYKHKTLIRKLYALNTIVENADVAMLIKQKIFDLRFSKIMVDLDSKTIKWLLKYVADVTQFHHIELNGLPYYETSNMWRSFDILERPDYDPDTPCSDYFKCEHNATIWPTTNDKIKYFFEHDYSERNIIYHHHDKFDRKRFLIDLARHELKNVLLTGLDEIKIVNRHGKNSDHRGSDHCKVMLPMCSEVILQKHVTLHDIVVAFYKLKSHKWDKHYEMFLRSNVMICGNVANIKLLFDHGS